MKQREVAFFVYKWITPHPLAVYLERGTRHDFTPNNSSILPNT